MSQDSAKSGSIVDYYMARIGLSPSGGGGDSTSGLESVEPRLVTSLTDKAVKDSVEQVRTRLEQFAKNYYGDPIPAEYKSQIDTICSSVKDGLRLLDKGNAQDLKENPDAVSGLESIILGDGTRPLYLIQDDKVDFKSTTSLVKRVGNTQWESSINESYSRLLKSIIPSVGILRSPRSTNYGTGFLVAPDLLMTNRHVWEKHLKSFHDHGYREITVDFQHEHGMEDRPSGRSRQVESLIFLGLRDSNGVKDPATAGATDVALLSLRADDAYGQTPIRIQSGEWQPSSDEVDIFLIGHPVINEEDANLFEKFLSGTSGVKRLSPGEAIRNNLSEPIYHTASTLAGCSGGLIVSPQIDAKVSPGNIALALHFGDQPVEGSYLNSIYSKMTKGARADLPRMDERWLNAAKAMPDLLDLVSADVDTAESGTLGEILERFGASFQRSPF